MDQKYSLHNCSNACIFIFGEDSPKVAEQIVIRYEHELSSINSADAAHIDSALSYHTLDHTQSND